MSDVELQAKCNIIFAGCDIAYGSATAVVIATGPRTEAGQIGAQVIAFSIITAAAPHKAIDAALLYDNRA